MQPRSYRSGRGGRVAVGGDGQVTLGSTVMKADAVKVRKLLDGQVLVGFAGSAADGFALLERFEAKLRDHPENLLREPRPNWPSSGGPTACSEGSKPCSSPPTSRHSLLLSGSGDVIQPTDGILCAGSGGGYALAAARALDRATPSYRRSRDRPGLAGDRRWESTSIPMAI